MTTECDIIDDVKEYSLPNGASLPFSITLRYIPSYTCDSGVYSDEELARYITSESGGKYPAVDFTKYTMIIAGGGASRGIYDVIVDSLQQLSDTEYSLNISVVMSKTDAPELWTKALLVDKWDKLCKVHLDVETIELIN